MTNRCKEIGKSETLDLQLAGAAIGYRTTRSSIYRSTTQQSQAASCDTFARMGTKRDASLNLSSMDEGGNKKQNKGPETTDLPAMPNGGNDNNKGERSDVKSGETLDPIKVNEAIKKLKNIARNQRDEIREGISAITSKMGEMYIAHSATATSANFYGDFMEELSARMTDAELREKARDRKIDEVILSVQKVLSQVKVMDKKVSENTQARKSNNLVLNGVPEKEGENCMITATNYLRHIDPKFEQSQILNAYRIGRRGAATEKHRTLLVKFKDITVKEDIVRKKTVLKNKKELSKFHCNEDLSDTARKVRQEMREIVKYALNNGYSNMKVSGNKIQWNDKVFYEDELYLLPSELQLSNIKTRPVGGGIGFQSEHSYLSSFFPCTIRMHQSVFCSAEQAFQYHKAIICEREDVGLQLKQLSDPAKIKKNGDRIETCDEWERSKVATMKGIVLQKFSQNPELKAKLLGTSGTRLMECTNNRFWGVGWFLDDPGWKEPGTFPGRNMLGTILEEVRDSFDIDVLNTTDIVRNLETPMAMETDITRVEKVPKPKQPALTSANIQATARPTAKELSKGINPTTLLGGFQATGVTNVPGTKATTHNIADEPESTERSSDTGEAIDSGDNDISEPDNYDAVSFTSSIFGDGNDSFDARNVTLPNGRLDVDKLMSWSLPTVNLSRILDRSVCKSPNTKNKIVKLMEAQRGSGQPPHSTPAVGNISMIRTKNKRRKKGGDELNVQKTARSEKESIKKMLEDMKT